METIWQDSVLLIVSSDPSEQSFGTGFVIYKDQRATYLLTCTHVIREVGGSGKIQINASQAKVIASSPEEEADLAILSIEGLLNTPALPLRVTGEKSKPFSTVGFQLAGKQIVIRELSGTLGKQVGVQMRRQAGRIKAWDLEITDKDPLQSGYSGSPVIDEHGYVIGMVNTQRGEGRIGAAISIEALEKLQLEMPSDLFVQMVRLAPIQAQYDAAMQVQRWDEAQTACTEALRLAPEDGGWQRRQAHVRTSQASAELRHRLTDGSYLEKKLREEGVEAVLTELTQGENDEILHNLAIAVRCGMVVLKQTPEEIWNQAKGRADITLYSSRSRSMPRFDLRFATLFPADEALVRIFVGHTSQVHDCAFSPDGRLALSASKDKTLRLWEIANGETVRVFEGYSDKWHRDQLNGCAFSPDGQMVLGASDSGILHLWDVASGETVCVIEGYAGSKYGYAFSPDGRQVLGVSIANGEYNTLHLWDVVSGETVRVFAGHTKAVNDCAFSLDGLQVVSVSDDGTLRLWDVASGETTRVIEELAYRCAFSPDGRQVLSEGYRMLHLLDVASGKIIRDFEVNASVNGCAFSPDGRYALSASEDKLLRLWNVTSGEMVRVFAGHTAEVNSCAFSPDGRYALSASGNLFDEYDCSVRLWDLTNMTLPRSFAGHTAEVNGCAISSDGRYTLSASSDSTLRLWDIFSGDMVRIFKGHIGKVAACAFSPNGQQALSIGDEMRLWDVATGKMIYTFREAYSSGGDGCTFSPDGQKALCIGGLGGTLDMWDVATGAMIHSFKIRSLGVGTYIGSIKGISGGALSPDGRQVVYGSHDGTLRLFDTTSGREIHVFDDKNYGHRKRCVFRPNGQQVLSAGRDLLLWDVTSGAVARSFEGHTDEVNCCVFSTDGRHVLSASDDCTLRLWSAMSGRELARWTTDTPLLCCAIGSNDETIIAGDNMGGLHFLSIVT